MQSHAHDAAQPEDLGLALRPGDSHYRAFVGPPVDYDLVAAMTFGLLTVLGMRQQHRVLDIGCGSLRVGRLLLPYLNRGGYTGLEPYEWLVTDGIRREVGQDQVDIKQPRFVFSDNADALLVERQQFDYAIAQSIFSHCGPDLLERWVSQVAGLLSEQGALVATYIEADDDNTVDGWIYPGCVGYRQQTIEQLAARHGLSFAALDWRHPRQRWVLMAKPGFDLSWLADSGLGWNAAFDRFKARNQA